MLTNPPQTPKHYEAAIALMQAYDCSYEDAERHLRLLSGQRGNPPQQHLPKEEEEGVEDESLGRGEGVISFTPKELRALTAFFNGTPVHLRSPQQSSLCGRTCQRLKALRRKLRCLKQLHPQRLWHAFRQRQSSSYNRLASVELNGSTSQPVKRQQASSGRWREVDSEWMDGLEEEGQMLQQYLSSHRDLLDEVKAVTDGGVKVAVPVAMALPARPQPFLFVRSSASQEVAENAKLIAEKTCRIICLDQSEFGKLFPTASGQAVVVTGCNIFLELQVLGQWGSGVSVEDVDSIPLRFKEFLIKNRLFQSIVDRDLSSHAFTRPHHHHNHHQQQQSLSQEDDEEGTEEEHRESDSHQSIIREQDMLYQSMLSTYTARETQKESADQQSILRERQRQSLRQSLREEPSPCPSSTLQLTFRTPSGSVLSRRFMRSDSVEYVREWVWASEEVEWEESGGFQLYHGYPPALLDCPSTDTLSSVFGTEGQVRLIIKETE